jgi:hypothetical protein
MLSSSLAVPGISLFPIKGDENGESGLTTVHAWVKYVVMEIFRLVDEGLNNVLRRVPSSPPILAPYLNK